MVLGAMYIIVQQNYRMSANDPQIQMSEDAARALNTGAEPASLVNGNKIDIAQSLAPFMVIYNLAGKPVASSGYLNGQMPNLPPGVFEYVKNHGEDRITWQPGAGVRNAAVINKYDQGFVMAGRSLREIENRIDNLTKQAGLAWFGILAALAALAFLFKPKEAK